jgi:Uma2 family endonuclease
MELVIDLKKRYTYADYLTWADDKIRELIDGFIKIMSPSASLKHQEVCGILIGNLYRMIRKNRGKCKVFFLPFDVRLPKNGEKGDKEIYNVVQPDICVVCDLSKLDKRGCLGAPDLVIEIQSHSTAKYDLTQKFALYETSGVREYWIVYPYEDVIDVFLLQPDGKYDEGTKYETGKIPVRIFDDCEIDLEEIFQ